MRGHECNSTDGIKLSTNHKSCDMFSYKNTVRIAYPPFAGPNEKFTDNTIQLPFECAAWRCGDERKMGMLTVFMTFQASE